MGRRARYVMAYGGEGDFAALDLQRREPRSFRSRRRWPAQRRAMSMHTSTPSAAFIGPASVRVDRSHPRSDRARDRQSAIDARRLSTERHRSASHPYVQEAVDGGAIAKNIEIDRSGAARCVARGKLLVDGPLAGQVSWSVEDFVPQRLRVAVEASEAVLWRGQSRPINAGGLPMARRDPGLAVEAEGRLMVDPGTVPGFCRRYVRPRRRSSTSMFQLRAR